MLGGDDKVRSPHTLACSGSEFLYRLMQIESGEQIVEVGEGQKAVLVVVEPSLGIATQHDVGPRCVYVANLQSGGQLSTNRDNLLGSQRTLHSPLSQPRKKAKQHKIPV